MSESILYPVSIDTENPTVGDFTYGSGTPSSVTLLLGSPSTDIHFHRYRLFYRVGLVEPSESDLEHIEAFFDHIDYDGETQVTVTGLDITESYTFILYVYDTFGNFGKNNTITKSSIIGVNGLLSGTPTLGKPAANFIYTVNLSNLVSGYSLLGEPAVTQIYIVAPQNVLSGYPIIGTPVAKLVYKVAPQNVLSGYPIIGTPVVVFIYSVILNNLITQAPYLGEPVAILKVGLRNLSSVVVGTFIIPLIYGEYRGESIMGTLGTYTLFGKINTDE